jgi:hypothetical protein
MTGIQMKEQKRQQRTVRKLKCPILAANLSFPKRGFFT